MTLRTRLEGPLAGSPAPSLLVVTDSYVGTTLAADYESVADVGLVTDSERVAKRAPDGVRTDVGDLTAPETLAAGSEATVAVVAVGRDRRALLVTQLLRTQFDIGSVVVLLNDPERHDVVDDVATHVVCGSSCLSGELGAALEQTLPEPSESHS
ncbi:NAD-binding protein [Haloarcula laminariae]|uniref:NAD-binding protein n=1 Tax=Haloarcula laminariae TaxID=2961577 RepID=UPI0021C9B007|nr:NAD-binding protein [Halomicroarcula laminariae]